ncbi:unnamed protein product [Cylindrotheca closterium]|uniref:Uncharacterized protein n=1 Tax=Cylindrotheca closterium TaxID=2856 RepID=A0AAD2CT44_9STRA|nr:unnamed protein product [Cylindrotheca closterium]
MREEEYIKELKRIEEQVRKLRLDLDKEREKKAPVDRSPKDKKQKFRRQQTTSGKLSIGDQVRIANPNKGQESEGEVTSINRISGFVTVHTRTQRIRRLAKNLDRLEP